MAGLLLGGAVVVAGCWGVVQRLVPTVGPAELVRPQAEVSLARQGAVESPEAVLQKAEGSLARKEYDAAERFATRVAPEDPLWARSQLVAGEAATHAGRLPAALAYYQAIPRDGSSSAVTAARAMGELYRAGGMLTEAEQQYAYVLEHDPEDAATHQRMAFILDVTGRRWESLPHLLFLVRTRNGNPADLIVLGDSERPIDQEAYLRQSILRAPDDVLVKLGVAWSELAAHEYGEGNTLALLEEVVAARPDLSGAQALLGELLIDESQDFVRWHAGLPEAAEAHPGIWYVRGLWASRHGESPGAARCFWEALRRAPEHRRATYQLGLVLEDLGNPAARDFGERATELIELAKLLDHVDHTQGRHEKSLRKLAQSLEGLGRLWEAWAWAGIAGALHPRASWPAELVDRLQGQLEEDLPRTAPAANPALRYDLSHYAIPERLLARTAGRAEVGRPDEALEASVRFEEETRIGLDFVYHNGADRATRGARMFEQTGGGVAALDYDRDGWPDLYFTQGNDWETGAPQPTLSAEHWAGCTAISRAGRLPTSAGPRD